MGIYCFHAIDYTKNQWSILPGNFKNIVDEIMKKEPCPEFHFDDARDGVYMWAVPYLKNKIKEGKCTAVIFPVINYMDGINIPSHEKYSAFMTWRALEECSGLGFQIGSHTMSHQPLHFMSEHELWKELFLSKKRLEKDLGAVIDKLSYPYGAYNSAMLPIVKQHYSKAYALQNLKLGNCPDDANFEIPRRLVIEHF